MINIKVQSCGLVILLVILFIYSRQKKLNLSTEKAFFRLLIAMIFSLIFDILSLVGMYWLTELPEWLVDGFCKTYLSSLIIASLSALIYVCVDIYSQSKAFRYRRIIYSSLGLLGIILVFVLPIHKELSDVTHMYTYGASVVTTYLFCLLFLGLIVFLTLYHKRSMNPKRVWAVWIWMVLWLVSAFIQFLNNSRLIVGFASSVGLMVIYLLLENPESNRDRESGLFNETALQQYAKQLFSKNEDFGLIALVFPWTELSAMDTRMQQFLIVVTDYVCSLPEVYAFQCNDDTILLVLKQGVNIEKIETMLRSRFTLGWGTKHESLVKPAYMIMPSVAIMSHSEEILPFLRFAKQVCNTNTEDNRIVLDQSLLQRMHEKREVEQLISDALKYDRIQVYYQPIYSTKERKFTSAEALCRIYNEDGAIIPPGRFIEIAEQNGMILELGERVFEKVCQFIHSGACSEGNLEYIEVNLSVIQCSYELLAQRFIHIMEQYEICPSYINLEITETGSVSTRKIMMDNMQRLLAYGVHFSLDDFGTGHSNLNYIVDMPVKIVKFDRSMTVSYFNNGKAKYVMDAAMHMIHGMELQIVSEGIETEEQLQTMESLNINYIQGFYFSKPLPEQEFLEFLRVHKA